MQRFTKALAAIMLMMSLLIVIGCNKQDNSDVRVTTYKPQDITQTTAKCGGDAIVTQGLSLTELGVCWGMERNPTAEDSHLFTTNWSEPYVCTITGLAPGTNYHVRAYALRGLEYYYGEDKNFTTEGNSGGGGGGYDNHTWVDLGLPSGTLWATCNVGAATPESYGNYYAWGETYLKDSYTLGNYQYFDGSNLTRYNGSDGLASLLLEDDAAAVNWGDGWRMPNMSEWRELIYNTTMTWTTSNSVFGMLFTATNGNSLFLPAAGYRDLNSLSDAGSRGVYWSRNLDTEGPLYARIYYFDMYLYYDESLVGSYRYCGRPVRAVRSTSQH